MTLAEMQFVRPIFALPARDFILVMACLIMIVDLSSRTKRDSDFVLTQLALIGAAVVTFMLSSVQVLYTFNNMFVGDLLGDLLKLLVYLTVIVVLFYSRGYVLDRPQMQEVSSIPLPCLPHWAMMVMISANHFLTIYIGIELLSLSLYAMVALNRD